MLMTAEETTGDEIAGPIVVILVLAASTIFLAGWRHAVMQRANSDYKKTKEALPGLRKGFWSALFAFIKVAFWVGLVMFALIAWWIRSAREDVDTTTDPSPSPSVTTTHR